MDQGLEEDVTVISICGAPGRTGISLILAVRVGAVGYWIGVAGQCQCQCGRHTTRERAWRTNETQRVAIRTGVRTDAAPPQSHMCMVRTPRVRVALGTSSRGTPHLTHRSFGKGGGMPDRRARGLGSGRGRDGEGEGAKLGVGCASRRAAKAKSDRGGAVGTWSKVEVGRRMGLVFQQGQKSSCTEGRETRDGLADRAFPAGRGRVAAQQSYGSLATS
ncbi:uncharacterized protein J3D65DRAFT_32716 [Phyllosticta citribraziliensis]|uniref:Uncharacterized protein n=1 Tax=Phyllosticta citribraziliensis TaxID=989973 RepID=A0ABR1M9Z8_9PEZI